MSQKTITVHILDREYQFAASDNERQSLLAAANYLDDVMKKIKESNSTLSPEKVSIMAALNISHEMMQFQHAHGKVKSMKNTLEKVLQQVTA